MELNKNKINVLHLIDTLDIGGAERVAVNLVNLLPRDEYKTFLCTTRRIGPLQSKVNKDVKVLSLNRKYRFDLRALIKLYKFIVKSDINIIHAHLTSLFIAKR